MEKCAELLSRRTVPSQIAAPDKPMSPRWCNRGDAELHQRHATQESPSDSSPTCCSSGFKVSK